MRPLTGSAEKRARLSVLRSMPPQRHSARDPHHAAASAGPALGFEYLHAEQVLISYQGAKPGSAEEWDRYIDLMETVSQRPTTRYLVYHDGPPPTLRDQQRIAALARPHKPLVALISSSGTLRFVVSAFSLVTRQIRFFPPDQVREALAHLGLDGPAQRAVKEALERLRMEVESEPSSIRDVTHR
jgi:hypothetical protein